MKGLAALLVAVSLGSGAVLVGGCVHRSSPAEPPPPAAVIVTARNVAFTPQSATIHTGETVAWRFDDGVIAHDVSGAGWHSPVRTSGYYTHVFDAPGTFAYRCTIHSGMDGSVVVTP